MSASAKNHRERILDVSLGVILSKGFPAARVDEICAEAGVTKGSFYHHFESKDALAFELVEHYFEGVTQALAGGTWSKVGDPRKRLFAFLNHAVTVLKGPLMRKGCLLGSLALDLSETNPELREVLEERFDSLVAFAEELFVPALRENKVPGAPTPRLLARQFVSVLQGSIVMAKAYDDHRRMSEGMRCYMNLVRGLVPE